MKETKATTGCRMDGGQEAKAGILPSSERVIVISELFTWLRQRWQQPPPSPEQIARLRAARTVGVVVEAWQPEVDRRQRRKEGLPKLVRLPFEEATARILPLAGVSVGLSGAEAWICIRPKGTFYFLVHTRQAGRLYQCFELSGTVEYRTAGASYARRFRGYGSLPGPYEVAIAHELESLMPLQAFDDGFLRGLVETLWLIHGDSVLTGIATNEEFGEYSAFREQATVLVIELVRLLSPGGSVDRMLPRGSGPPRRAALRVLKRSGDRVSTEALLLMARSSPREFRREAASALKRRGCTPHIDSGLPGATPRSGISAAFQTLLALARPSNDAAFVDQSAPLSMAAGQPYQVTVRMKNTGSGAWLRAPGAGVHRLGSQAPQDNVTWGMGRVELPSDVTPGETVAICFQVCAPSRPGKYILKWRMVEEWVEWFGDSTPSLVIKVG